MMVSALKKKKKEINQVLDVFLNTQLVILMTNLPMLLFPREHHYTQPKYSKLGFLYREQGEKMTDLFCRSLARDIKNPALEELTVHPENTASMREAA